MLKSEFFYFIGSIVCWYIIITNNIVYCDFVHFPLAFVLFPKYDPTMNKSSYSLVNSFIIIINNVPDSYYCKFDRIL